MPWAQETLANFLTEPVRGVVRAEVCDPHTCAGKLYGKPRIFNDLLSGQPLCFNLFDGLSVMLFPQDNPHVSAALVGYRQQLSNEVSFAAWTIEDVIDSVRDASPDAPWTDAFRDRFLAFARIDELLGPLTECGPRGER